MGVTEKVAADKQEPVGHQVEPGRQGVNKRQQHTRAGDRQETARHQAAKAMRNTRKTEQGLEGPSRLQHRRGKRPCC